MRLGQGVESTPRCLQDVLREEEERQEEKGGEEVEEKGEKEKEVSKLVS